MVAIPPLRVSSTHPPRTPPPPVQEYYANTGAMKAAADTLRAGEKPGVACSIVEAFGGEPTPRDLEPRERCSAAAGEGDGEGKGQ